MAHPPKISVLEGLRELLSDEEKILDVLVKPIDEEVESAVSNHIIALRAKLLPCDEQN